MEENTKSENVKRKALKEICKISTGKLNANAKVENGEYPFFTCQKVPNKINKYSFNTEAVLMAGNGNVGNVHYYSGKFDAYQRTYVIESSEVNVKFLYYYLKTFFKGYIENYKKEGIISYITLPVLEKFLVPLPPLKKQEKIAAVLDKFTELTEELTEELTAREAQYEYYRNMLLSQEWIEKEEGKEVEWKALEEVIEYEQPTKYIVSSKKYNDKFSAPVLTAGQSFILGYTDESEGIYNASTEKPVVIFDDFTTSNHWIDFDFKVKSSALKILKAKDSVISLKYCYYYMQTILFDISEHRRKWISQYSKIKIPFPSLETQQKIVKILDNFETLVNDIRQGLPKEIELRQKQYEYYRKKLLTFEEK